ncbi:hypothetical protein GCM10010339_63160 [Streptomyces alanosinicus]|uniref:Uncharacterized protein n=1 Tax=Streptomyces alanosinicus TaxID=68171 RepID=A0A918YNT4_9ACTN|nr:hypothetical protein GCM10010339_63160 [Streptomyces alanosinicus]
MTEESFDALTQGKGAGETFQKGMAAALNARPAAGGVRRRHGADAHEADDMVALVKSRGLDHQRRDAEGSPNRPTGISMSGYVARRPWSLSNSVIRVSMCPAVARS